PPPTTALLPYTTLFRSRALRELPMQDRQSAGLEVPPEFSVAELQAAIPAETALVEYYSAGDRLVAAVVTRENVEIKPLGGIVFRSEEHTSELQSRENLV